MEELQILMADTSSSIAKNELKLATVDDRMTESKKVDGMTTTNNTQ